MQCVCVILLSIALFGFVFRADGFSIGSTCLNRCDGRFHSLDDFQCQCNQQCVKYNDCCPDYQKLCLAPSNSCQGRCQTSASGSHTCQCNSHCLRYNDCCPDYNIMCIDSTPSSGTCKTQSEMGKALWDSDVNRLSSSDVIVNYQTRVPDGTSSDSSSGKLFAHVNETRLASPTYAAFLKLLDNYNPQQTSTEHSTSHETAEMYAFLDAVLETKVMAELLDFLVCQSKVTSKSDLRATLKMIWFDFYQRSSKYSYHSTSGFEHILVGEFKDASTVSGFHSWLSFYQKEKTGSIDYLGYVSISNPGILGAAFTWDGRLKTKGTFFIGTSPEFDMAVYTLCYLMHKDAVCSLTVDGHSISIQTYDSNGHIATAYIR